MALLFVIPTFATGSDLDFHFRTTFYTKVPADFITLRGTEGTWVNFASAVLMLNVVNLLGDGLMVRISPLYTAMHWTDERVFILAIPLLRDLER